ncbi:hypothetical protein C0583_01670 [Candidatus Parcubacteria bacterium]|nr:MAG: hypothetical protein C0583_01670 [Candidatus Parcubacteria bacterium]
MKVKKPVLLKNVLIMHDNPVKIGITTRDAGNFRMSDKNFWINMFNISNHRAIQSGKFNFMKPEHETRIRSIKENNIDHFSGDGLFYKHQDRFVAMIHCSHITISKGIIFKTFNNIKSFVSIDKLNAFIYPGICQDCYEVREDVIQKFQDHSKCFKNHKSDSSKKMMDIAKIIHEQVFKSGIHDKNINTIKTCSAHTVISYTPAFYSWRARKETSRNLIFVKLPNSEKLLCSNTGDCPYLFLYK